MYWIYVLQSERSGRYYIGFSQDVDARLHLHNAGRVKSTHTKGPWKVIYTEPYADAKAARQREHYLKSMKSRRALDDLLARGPLAQSVRAQS